LELLLDDELEELELTTVPDTDVVDPDLELEELEETTVPDTDTAMFFLLSFYPH
jgi:hypothetical protein